MVLDPAEPHLPLEDPPFRMAMGLVAADPLDLAEVDARYPAQMRQRLALLDAADRDDTIAWVDETEAARAAVLERVLQALLARHGAHFAAEGGTVTNRLTGEVFGPGERDPLEIAARLVTEDLCVLRPGADGPVLVAGAVCFPSRWRLSEKLGRPLAAIHVPVPLYEARLRGPVDRFFAALRPGKMVVRRNWGVYADPALRQLGGAARDAGGWWLRVERQTLSRIGDDTLFTIGTHVRPLAQACARPADAARMLAAIEAMPEEMLVYKGMDRAALGAWLRVRL